jgi:hypothetical protein
VPKELFTEVSDQKMTLTTHCPFNVRVRISFGYLHISVHSGGKLVGIWSASLDAMKFWEGQIACFPLKICSSIKNLEKGAYRHRDSKVVI